KHKNGGRNPKLTVEEQLLLTLKYLRQYVTQKELAYEFEVGEATVHDVIVWVENRLWPKLVDNIFPPAFGGGERNINNTMFLNGF
ncbi:MAG: transposase family protein, partial [Oscillospiraceae bacterium]|nr:transposase family protein [Oscillospiraceae bacterium]